MWNWNIDIYHIIFYYLKLTSLTTFNVLELYFIIEYWSKYAIKHFHIFVLFCVIAHNQML